MSTQDYSCTVDDSFMYYVMYVTNNSDKVVSIDLNVTALDSSGSMVGSSSDGTKAVAPGQTAGIWTTFDDGIRLIVSITHCRYQRKRNTLLSILTYPLTTILPTAALCIRDKQRNFRRRLCMYGVVYLKDGKMVNFSELSFMDDNQELQPGTTLSQEGTCYSDSVLMM